MRIVVPLLVCAAVLAVGASGSPAPRFPDYLEIGLLLIAIDAQPDHLRISEGLRVSNSGSPVTYDFTATLPSAATFVTFHRGLVSPHETAGGFSETLRVPTGVTEIAYSYALPAARDTLLTRVFPLRARRIEVVVRGPGVSVTVRGGTALPRLRLGDQQIARWELRDVPSGAPVIIALRGLPVTRRWIPVVAATALALVLVAGLVIALRRPEGRTAQP